MHLDNVIFQLGMAPIIPKIKQLVNHQHILVNDHTINIPSYHYKPQDFITIKDRQKSQAIIMRSMDYSQGYKTPDHLTPSPTGRIVKTSKENKFPLKVLRKNYFSLL
jgi:small subunit ribosomal protein S4